MYNTMEFIALVHETTGTTDEIVHLHFAGYKNADDLRKFLESANIRVHKIIEVHSVKIK